MIKTYKNNSLQRQSRFIIITILSIFFIFLTACSPSKETAHKPLPLTRAATCAVCGMIVLDYAGPHVQIVWKDGTRTYYCDLHEVMPQLLNPIEVARVAVVYVQNFDNLKWGSYKANWINAKEAIFVVNSRKKSSMGISYVPFLKMKYAKLFQQQNGGKIVRYNQITPELLEETRQLMLTHPGSYAPSEGDRNKHNH